MRETEISRTAAVRCVAVVLLAVLIPAIAQAQAGPPGTVRYYHVDALGSIRAVTDAQGHVVARHDYFPFGDGPADGADPSALRFTGKERDRESWMDYFGARYYASRTGRFTTSDPAHIGGNIFDPQSWNAYAYARNNPLRFLDPTGKEYEVCGQNAGCNVVADLVWDPFIDDAGWGFNASGHQHDPMRSYPITAWVNGRWVFAGHYTYLGPDQPRNFSSMVRVAGDMAEPGVKLGVGIVIATTAIPAAAIAGGALVAGGGVTLGLGATGTTGAIPIVFKTMHYAPRLAAAGVSITKAEAAVRGAIAMGQRGGELVVDGVTLIWRSHVYNGLVYVGTIHVKW